LSSIVTPGQHRASYAPVNNESEFGETSRWRRWRRAEKTAPAVERSTFPRPDADTQILPQAPHRPAASSLPPLHHDPSTNPDLVALNMIRVCSQSMAEHWSATRLNDALLTHNGELHKRAMREQEGGATIARRVANGHRTAQQTAEAIEAAVRVEQVTGVKVPLDPAALGKGMARSAANAHDLSEHTMVGLPRITEGMPDPRIETVTVAEPASPVQVPGTHPPVPDDEVADPHAEALPKRVPHPVHVMPAPMSEGENPQPVGLHPVKPAYGEVHEGDWVFDDSADAAVLKLVRQVTVVRGGNGDPVSARVFFADGSDRRVLKDRTVRVLGTDAAAALLEKYEAQVAQIEAAR